MLSHKLRIFGVAIQFTQPTNLAEAFLAVRERFTLPGIEMERPLFLLRIGFYLIKWGQSLIVDRSPSVTLDPLIPALMVILLWLVKLHIDCIFPLLILDLGIIARSESVDIDHRAMHENLVVDQWRELETTETESNMAFRRWV